MSDILVGSVAVDIVPDTRGFATKLKAKLKDVNVNVGVNLDDARAKKQLDALSLSKRSVSIKAEADTKAAEAQLDKLARNRTSKIRANVDRGSLASASSGLSGLTAGILTLGPALVPITGALVGLAGVLAAPVAAAGGGLTLGAIIGGAAVKKTNEQSKKIQELKKKMDAAKASLAATATAAGAGAANSNAAAARSASASLASARRSTATTIASAQAAVARATTPAGRAAAERRIVAARASLANREASIQASLTNRQAGVQASADTRRAAAQQKVTDATAAYKAALAGLTPAQKKFIDSKNKLKASFDNLVKSAGPAILGPISKGLGLLAKVLPNLKPLLVGVAGGVNTLLKGVGKFASGPEFKAFMQAFGKASGDAIVSFGRIFGNVTKGFFGIFKAFAPLSKGFVDSLETLSEKFAAFGQGASSNAGFQRFLAYIRDVGPKVATTFGDIVKVAVKVGIALAPLGGLVLDLVDGLAKFILNAKPSTLSAIGIAIGGVALAFGKGPLGLAFALGATLSHSDGFITFLKKAGKLAGNLGDAFNKLPDGIKAAAVAAVGVGIIASKLSGLTGGPKGGNPLSSKGGLFGLISKAKPIPVFVTNEGFGLPGKPGKPKPTPTGVPPILGFPLPGVAGINAEVIDPRKPKGPIKIPFTDTKIGTGRPGAKVIPDSKLNMDQLKAEFADVLKNGTGKGLEADKVRLREIQTAMDTLAAKTKAARAESSGLGRSFDPAIAKAQSLKNEVKLIGSNARGARAEVKALLKLLEDTRQTGILNHQAVTPGRQAKVDGQLGRGSTEFRGTLSLDRDGTATLRGIGRDAVDARHRRQQADARNRAIGGESFR